MKHIYGDMSNVVNVKMNPHRAGEEMKLPYWLTKRNLIIGLILGLAAAVFAMRTGEDNKAKDVWAAGTPVTIDWYDCLQCNWEVQNGRNSPIPHKCITERACSSGEVDKCDWDYCIAHPRKELVHEQELTSYEHSGDILSGATAWPQELGLRTKCPHCDNVIKFKNENGVWVYDEEKEE